MARYFDYLSFNATPPTANIVSFYDNDARYPITHDDGFSKDAEDPSVDGMDPEFFPCDFILFLEKIDGLHVLEEE